MKQKFIIKIIISAILLYFVVHKVNFKEIFWAIENANFNILLFALFLHIIGLFLSVLRWKILLTIQNVKAKIGFLYLSYWVATFFNLFLPSTVGGDTVRAYDSWKLGDNKEKAFAVIILDRFLGLLALLIFAVISIMFSDDIAKIVPGIHFWAFVISLGAGIIIWFIVSPPLEFFLNLSKNQKGLIGKIAGLINKIDIAFSRFTNKKKSLFLAFILSILLQLNVVLYYYAISLALNLKVEFIDYFLIVPLTIFITMLPISFNGIGLRENALFLFLAPFGVLLSQAIAFAWIEFGMLLIIGAVGGIIYMLRK